MIPKLYSWLGKMTLPAILAEAVKLLGTTEVKGSGDSPLIMGWAKEVGGWVSTFYEHDSIPWCGLFVGVCAKRAGIPFGQKMLGAKNWKEWGAAVQYPMLGDVLIFDRDGGGHVGLYVAEGKDAKGNEVYHVLGGNQGDAVTIAPILKERMEAARCGTHDAENRKRIFMDTDGKLSDNEA